MTNSELRKKIAELKGFTIEPQPSPNLFKKETWYALYQNGEFFTRNVFLLPDMCWDDCPDWTGDISVAWQLIQEAEAKGVGYSMSDCHHSDGRITHDFAFFAPVMGPASRKYWSEAGTVPLAICEAYVKMLEGER